MLAKGVGSTHLAPGTIDVLGYAPDRVERPREALEGLVAAHPEHPYALLGAETVAAALEWFAARVARWAAARLPLRRRPRAQPPAPDRGRGAAPVGAGARDDGRGRPRSTLERVLHRRLPRAARLPRRLCAANLQPAGVEARAVEVDLELERADQNSLGLARRFDDPAWRAAFAAQLALQLRADERVGLPAMLGLRDPHGAWSDLEQRLGAPVFEIPTLPPSVPGMRLFEILRAALRARRRPARARRRGRRRRARRARA